MAHRRVLIDRVLVSAWRTPEHEDIQTIQMELSTDRARLGRPLLYLSVIGPASLPTGEVRDELSGFYQHLLVHCESIHVVIEGTEFQQSIKRSVIANVLLLAHARGRVFIENTMAGVLASSPPAVRAELGHAGQIASEQRLFDFARQADAT